MTKQFFKDALLWGFILWLIGYVLGITFFMIMPPNLIGWVITPIGIIITIWAAWKIVKGGSWSYYFWVGIVWAALAILLDYLLLVQLFKPADGYYKLDVYLYYLLALFIPWLAGWRKLKTKNNARKI